MNRPLPVTVVTGFLGAGKTTVISNLLKQVNDCRFAVVVNEFGRTSIDADLIESASGTQRVEVINLTGGLIAPGSGNEFETGLLSIWERRREVDYVIVEASGLAVPTGVLQLLETGSLKDKFMVDATLNVVDCEWLTKYGLNLLNGAQSLSAKEIFRAQLESSDVVVLNRIDSMSHERLRAIEQGLRLLASRLRFLEPAFKAVLDPRVALGLKLNQPASVQGVAVGARPLHRGHSHTGFEPHEHGILTHEHLHEHDPGWMSFRLRSHSAQDIEQLRKALLEISASQPVLRCKGLVQTTNGRQVIVQVVRDRIDYVLGPQNEHLDGYHHIREVSQDHLHKHQAELTFIGYHLERQKVTALLNEHSGSKWK